MINIKHKKRVYDGFLKIDVVTFDHTKFDGSQSKVISREIIVRNEAVAGLFFHTEEQKYWFVEQIRIPTITPENPNGILLECIAGMIDDGETAEEAINREAIEEVGCSMKNLEYITTFYASPGSYSERVVVFYAELDEVVHEGGGLLTEGEDIRIVKFTFDEMLKHYQEDKFKDAKTTLAVQWELLRKLKNH